ncbi:deoxynucleoside triphosphate triphosphohydrolase SAMHD1-like [Brachionus plicatilis]|uniref:Deoxynucleoside triphosphate triphosphohydrolase SAMHD1-like n=1 Tax=Brachionus plicatilis TaxID=10195 RepID=A0A3M7R577_BRAPC|nr:deoxynucleoside triphosphate triphosphohydrolase SAMHD1-like [Brachionus plicatilis]
MSQNFKIIKDSVHGLIDLKPLIVKIIDTPEFQRLRNIKQLETLCYIYPCAVHNRFEHSIGTSYLARLFVEQIKKNQPELKITQEEALCVEIAGLCHDLGHGPFSHLFEDLAKKIYHKHNPNGDQKDANKFFVHEDVSLLIFDRIYSSLKKDFEQEGLNEKFRELIKELIYPSSIDEIIKLQKKLKENGSDKAQIENQIEKLKTKFEEKLGISIDKSFLFEIVSNVRNKIDVDKWDYFARDSFHLGINNTFDYKRFIFSSRVMNPDNTLNQICVRDKELRNVYEMFRTREDLHRRAYQLPKSTGVKEMMVDILYELDDVFEFYETLSKINTKNGLDNYLDLDDRILCITQKSFNKFVKDENLQKNIQRAKDLIERLDKRKLYKEISIKIIDLNNVDEWNKEKIKKRLIEETGFTEDDICIIESKINFGSKENDPLENLEFFDKKFQIVNKELIGDFNSKMKPQNFQEARLILFVKNKNILSNSDLKNRLKESFEKIIDENVNDNI